MQPSFSCTGRFADCFNDSDYTQQPRISLEGSSFTAASHPSLLLLRIHQLPLHQEQEVSKVHQAGIHFSSVCHWQKPRCPCLSGQCSSLRQTDNLTIAAAQDFLFSKLLSFTDCSWHAQLHACCICTHNSNLRFLLLVLACMHMDTHKDTHSHVCTKPCVSAFSCRQLRCLILQTTIHARQIHFSQYMLGKVILVNTC